MHKRNILLPMQDIVQVGPSRVSGLTLEVSCNVALSFSSWTTIQYQLFTPRALGAAYLLHNVQWILPQALRAALTIGR